MQPKINEYIVEADGHEPFTTESLEDARSHQAQLDINGVNSQLSQYVLYKVPIQWVGKFGRNHKVG